jgi:chromosome segregation ATPase
MLILFAAISLSFAATTLYLWRRLQSLQAASAEFSAKVNASLDTQRSLEQQRALLNEELGKQRKANDKYLKEISSLKERLHKAASEQEQAQAATAHHLEALQEKLEHHRTQEQALTSQLQGIDQHNKELRLKWEARVAEAQQAASEEKTRASKEIAKARSELKQAQAAMQRLEQELKHLKEKPKDPPKAKEAAPQDAQDVEKLQGRLQQAEKLYNLMRSHKELTAERNEYLVKVCQVLANAVIDIKQPDHQKPEAFGALVSAAINLVRQQEAANEPRA